MKRKAARDCDLRIKTFEFTADIRIPGLDSDSAITLHGNKIAVYNHGEIQIWNCINPSIPALSWRFTIFPVRAICLDQKFLHVLVENGFNENRFLLQLFNMKTQKHVTSLVISLRSSGYGDLPTLHYPTFFAVNQNYIVVCGWQDIHVYARSGALCNRWTTKDRFVPDSLSLEHDHLFVETTNMSLALLSRRHCFSYTGQLLEEELVLPPVAVYGASGNKIHPLHTELIWDHPKGKCRNFWMKKKDRIEVIRFPSPEKLSLLPKAFARRYQKGGPGIFYRSGNCFYNVFSNWIAVFSN